MTTHTPTPAESTVSPKVVVSTVAAFAAPVVVALLDAITLDLLVGLGAWAPVALAGIGALSAGVAGYLKRDPLRH